MPEIQPFCGVLFNPEKIKDIARVVAGPYDVISPAQQRSYYRAHPYNIIRLILGKCYTTDSRRKNRHLRAHRFFTDWLKKGIFLRDKGECIYIYAQSFRHNNRKKTRSGFIALLKLDDFAKNSILPHEDTFSQSVQDRLKLLRAVRANLSPIFALFCEQQGEINRLLAEYRKNHQPCIVVKKDNVLHRMWRIRDESRIAYIQRLLKASRVFIADGHHRYEAALIFKRQMQSRKQQGRKTASVDYIMTYLVPASDPGLVILPTHRVVRVNGGFKSEEFILSLEESFIVHRLPSAERLFTRLKQNGERRIFGAYLGKNNFLALKLKDAKSAYARIKNNEHNLNKDLDVHILHNLIIERIFNLAPSADNIYYTRDAREAIELVDKGKYQTAFFLRPATVAQVKKTACAGVKMPHKSTYFYPKPLSGLVINAFESTEYRVQRTGKERTDFC